MKTKPILFNTEMVRAILDGRKTATRRCVKPKSRKACGFYVTFRKTDNAFMGVYDYDENERQFEDSQTPPCQPGDILYVQETWKIHAINPGFCMMIRYRADNFCSLQVKFSPGRFDRFKKFHEKNGWQSPYFMPEEAARIWLRVTDVGVERLQDITPEEAVGEGTKETFPPLALDEFREIWESTIRKPDLDRYGWKANPWVWVIEFEQCRKPEGKCQWEI